MSVDSGFMKSKIYCHRGFWTSIDQQNSIGAFSKAIASGYGIETDIRDHLNRIVISHDPATDPELDLGVLPKTGTPIAINIKSDGLIKIGLDEIKEYVSNRGSFVFDASIPEMLKYQELNIPHALRLSEYEREIPWKSQFIWLDSFNSDWWLNSEILKKLTESHFVVVVSPELHARPFKSVWEAICIEMTKGNENLGICTDFPDQFLEMLQ